jgi:hypothetical protein
MRAVQRHHALFLLILLTGCSRPVQYLSTVRPLDLGVGPGACIAVLPNDPTGVWWWEPGATGCASRSTGPDVFKADRGAVSKSGDQIVITFQFNTQSSERPVVAVHATINGDEMSTTSGARVPVQSLSRLDIPEIPPRGRK